MIDKKMELDIKAVKSFIEFWNKFHSIYSDAISKSIITKEDEVKFIETKNMMRSKYSELTGMLEFKYAPHGRISDPVSDILLIDNIRFISEKNLKKIEDDWRDSYVFLNNILERLKSRKRRMMQFNPVGVFFKRILEKI